MLMFNEIFFLCFSLIGVVLMQGVRNNVVPNFINSYVSGT